MSRTSEGKEKEVKLDDFHRHEALDRVSVWLDHFCEYIAAHPVIVASPIFSSRCEKITDLCGELYQAIGQQNYEIEVSRVVLVDGVQGSLTNIYPSHALPSTSSITRHDLKS